MVWAKGPGAAKYKTVEHRKARAQALAQLRRDGGGLCAEPVCVMPSRVIHADMGRDLHLCHNEDGITYRGLGHWQCNIKDGAKRASAKAHRRQQVNTHHSRTW